jgi:hypothetical protein
MLIADHFRQMICHIVITTLTRLNLVQLLTVVKHSEQEFSETIISK